MSELTFARTSVWQLGWIWLLWLPPFSVSSKSDVRSDFLSNGDIWDLCIFFFTYPHHSPCFLKEIFLRYCSMYFVARLFGVKMFVIFSLSWWSRTFLVILSSKCWTNFDLWYWIFLQFRKASHVILGISSPQLSIPTLLSSWMPGHWLSWISTLITVVEVTGPEDK